MEIVGWLPGGILRGIYRGIFRCNPWKNSWRYVQMESLWASFRQNPRKRRNPYIACTGITAEETLLWIPYVIFWTIHGASRFHFQRHFFRNPQRLTQFKKKKSEELNNKFTKPFVEEFPEEYLQKNLCNLSWKSHYSEIHHSFTNPLVYHDNQN